MIRSAGIGLGAAAIALALSGCQSLEAKKLALSDRVGIGYVLPFTQFAVTVTWKLDYCPATPLGAGESPVARIALKVDADATSAEDGDLAFIISPQDLQTLTNVTSFTAKWQDGSNMLSTINATSEDRTAQILGNVVKTVVKILPLVAGLAPPGGVRGSAVAPVACDPKAAAALAAAKAAKNMLDQANDDVTAKTKALADATAQLGTNPGEGAKARRDAAAVDLSKAQIAQSDATDTLAEALKPISHTVKFRWPEVSSEFSHGPSILPPDVLGKWAPDAVAKPVYLQLERLGSFGWSPPYLDLRSDREKAGAQPDVSPIKAQTAGANPALPDDALKGLRYRMPAQGRLVACWRSPCGSQDVAGVLATFDKPVLQLGYVNVLPFRSHLFGNNGFSVEFAADGRLKSVGYEQKAASAETASGTLADAAGQFSDALNPTARLKAETDYLTQLKARRAALEALKEESAAELSKSSLGDDTALLNAQIANLEAQIKLAELKAKQPQ
jgi:hypothetical protein